MGLLINPLEIKGVIQKMIYVLHSNDEALKNVEKLLVNIVNEEELSGEAYTNVKLQMQDNIMLVNCMVFANEILMNDFRILGEKVGEERLVEDELKHAIVTYNEMIDRYEKLINHYENLMKNDIYAEMFGWYSSKQIEIYNKLIKNCEQMILVTNNKLNNLYDIDNSIKNLFENVKNIYFNIESGIYSLQGYKDNSQNNYFVNEKWRENLNEWWKNQMSRINSIYVQYGFTEQETLFLLDIFSKLENSKKFNDNDEKIHYIYSILAPLCVNYDAKRWRLIAGTYSLSDAKKKLKDAGVSDEEILDLQVLINLQHGNSAKILNEEYGIDVTKSRFCDSKVGEYNIKKDLAHEMIQLACFSNTGSLRSVPSKIVGLNTMCYYEKGYLNYEISFKGDIDSCRWGWDFEQYGNDVDISKVDWSDFTSDVDAINMYYRMRNGKISIDTLFVDYNNGLCDGTTKRSTEFFENLGNGNASDGILELNNVLKEYSIGGSYMASEHSEEELKTGKITFTKWIMEEYANEKKNSCNDNSNINY